MRHIDSATNSIQVSKNFLERLKSVSKFLKVFTPVFWRSLVGPQKSQLCTNMEF